ncbi:DUF5316 family protein [Bacillus sp. NPDC077027]|uniref:DUF5316 family protein n=1 Tax=Bacillus sp. NPDC077027 TaxID=3390548 RepID=UPI003D0179E8
MKKTTTFLIGIGTLAAVLIASILLQSTQFIGMICGAISLIIMIISGLLLGAFPNNPEGRARDHSESKDHRMWRTNTAFLLVLLGLPHMVATIFYFVF